MTEHRIIQADYANWRTVAGRKVLQLVFEVPIEQTADVLKKLGVPMPGESRWCAIALLENGKPANESAAGKLSETPRPSKNTEKLIDQTEKEPSPASAITAAAGTSEISSRERKPFASLPLSQQAAIRCGDEQFRWFLMDAYPGACAQHSESAHVVRQICGVGSRSAIQPGTAAELLWETLEVKYQSWLTDRQYADARR